MLTVTLKGRPSHPVIQPNRSSLMSYCPTPAHSIISFFSSFKGDAVKESSVAFDYLENALHKFDDGPFFLGQFSLVDIAYVPFVERFQIFFQEMWKYDITSERLKLAAWIEELNKMDAYKVTKCDPVYLVQFYKSRLMA